MTTRDAFIEEATELLRILDEDIDEGDYERGREYFLSVQEKAKAMLDGVEQENKPATPRMLQAIQNMRGGVERWTNKD